MADQEKKHGSPTLNVLLHGAFTFTHDRDTIYAMMPKLEQHAYRAGNWLAETEIRGEGASYRLTGVKAHRELTFTRENNLIVKVQRRSEKESPYATFKFPFPKTTRSLRVAKILGERPFEHPEDLLEPEAEQSIATLQVLTYDIDNENQLALKGYKEDHHWEPAFNGPYINLHIFCAEDHYHKPSNAQEDFNKCVELLGVKLRLNTRYVPTGILKADQRALDGIAPQETEPLAVRTRRMARLGRLISQEADTNLAWHGAGALDGDPVGCGGVLGCYSRHNL